MTHGFAHGDLVGSRAQVWHGSKHHTSGGLTKGDLTKNHKTGRIVSRRVQAASERKMKKALAGPCGDLFRENRRRIKAGKKPYSGDCARAVAGRLHRVRRARASYGG